MTNASPNEDTMSIECTYGSTGVRRRPPISSEVISSNVVQLLTDLLALSKDPRRALSVLVAMP